MQPPRISPPCQIPDKWQPTPRQKGEIKDGCICTVSCSANGRSDVKMWKIFTRLRCWFVFPRAVCLKSIIPCLSMSWGRCCRLRFHLFLTWPLELWTRLRKYSANRRRRLFFINPLLSIRAYFSPIILIPLYLARHLSCILALCETEAWFRKATRDTARILKAPVCPLSW